MLLDGAAPGCATEQHNHPKTRGSQLADDNLIKSPAQVVQGELGDDGNLWASSEAQAWSKDPNCAAVREAEELH